MNDSLKQRRDREIPHVIPECLEQLQSFVNPFICSSKYHDISLTEHLEADSVPYMSCRLDFNVTTSIVYTLNRKNS